MGGEISKQVEHAKEVAAEEKILSDLLSSGGDQFPGSDFHPTYRKSWMSGLVDFERLKVNQIVWPGTHDSATNEIGIPFITRPFAQCQTISIYDQLSMVYSKDILKAHRTGHINCIPYKQGTRVLDIRIQENRFVCHGIMTTYPVSVVIDDLKRFLSETDSEIVILEIRTEFGHQDPPEFDKYLTEQLGDVLIHQDDAVFDTTVAELLPRRVICVWKPRNERASNPGDPLWAPWRLKDNWIDTDLPNNKFESNMKYLRAQPEAEGRTYFYRVENTVTPQLEYYLAVWVKPVTDRIRKYARLFVSQAFARGFADRLQVLSTDFIDEDFVDACVGMTLARLEGRA